MIYERVFTLENVAQIHVLFQGLIREEREAAALARATGSGLQSGSRLALVESAYAEWQTELQRIATITALRATQHIQQRLQQTQKRPPTGETPHLADVIVSRPLTTLGFITGQVGVADENELDKAKNTYAPQYGPYWMTQEYGSPKMENRRLFGRFYDAGGGGSGYLPGGGGPHPLFITAAQGSAKPYGLMTIRHPPEARHFIRDGADLALGEWRSELKILENLVIARLRAASII